MNRGLLAFLIVIGVSAVAGTAAYVLTDMYGEPEGFLTPVDPGPPPPPPLGPPPQATEGMTFEQTIGAFDFRSQRLVWVLPPGVTGLGPWVADVTVMHGGEVKHQAAIQLTAEPVAPGTYEDLPRTAESIRLSAGDDWLAQRAQIKDMVDQLIAEHGPGGGEVTITSDFATEIAPAMKQAYCEEDRMPGVRIYVEQGTPATLTQLEVGPGEELLRAAVLSGCDAN